VCNFSWQFGPEIFEQSQKGQPNYFCQSDKGINVKYLNMFKDIHTYMLKLPI